MSETVLCYIKNDNRYLMLYRNKKKNDPNMGKWMGVGGHIESGETPDEAMRREIKEETNLDVIEYRKNGIVLFINDDYQELMHVYTITKTTGELSDCNEGTLKYFNKEDIYHLNMWEGDKAFLPYIFDEGDYFEIKLYYHHDKFIKMEKIK